jgi:hypothetical protein
MSATSDTLWLWKICEKYGDLLEKYGKYGDLREIPSGNLM